MHTKKSLILVIFTITLTSLKNHDTKSLQTAIPLRIVAKSLIKQTPKLELEKAEI